MVPTLSHGVCVKMTYPGATMLGSLVTYCSFVTNTELHISSFDAF